MKPQTTARSIGARCYDFDFDFRLVSRQRFRTKGAAGTRAIATTDEFRLARRQASVAQRRDRHQQQILGFAGIHAGFYARRARFIPASDAIRQTRGQDWRVCTSRLPSTNDETAVRNFDAALSK